MVPGREGHSAIHPGAERESAVGRLTIEASAYNQHLTDNKFGLRLDTNTHFGTLFGYYFFDQFSVTTPYAQGISFPGFDSGVQGRAQMINLGLTTTINNSTINDVRLVYLRDRYFGGVPIGGTGVPLTSLGFAAPAGTGTNFNGGIAPITPALEGVPSFFFNNYCSGSHRMPCVNSTTRSRLSTTSQKL